MRENSDKKYKEAKAKRDKCTQILVEREKFFSKRNTFSQLLKDIKSPEFRKDVYEEVSSFFRKSPQKPRYHRLVVLDISDAFTDAFWNLDGKNIDYKEKVEEAIRKPEFYDVWQEQEGIALERNKGLDLFYVIFGSSMALNLNYSAFVYTFSFASILSILTMFAGENGSFPLHLFNLPIAYFFMFLFGLFINKLSIEMERKHDLYLIETIGNVAYLATNDEDLNCHGLSYIQIIQKDNSNQVFNDNQANLLQVDNKEPTASDHDAQKEVAYFDQKNASINNEKESNIQEMQISFSGYSANT